MWFGTRALAVIVLGMLGTTGAQASVVYNWQPESGGEFVTVTGGQIVVTDRAYRAGSVDFGVGVTNGNRLPNADLSPIIEAGLSYTPAGGAFVAPYTRSFISNSHGLRANLNFTVDGYLTGNIYALASENNFYAEGVGDSWRATEINSDYFTGSGHCTGNYEQPCFGGAGYWLVDESTVPVPEPTLWPLLAAFVAGTLGLAAVRRRRSLHKINVAGRGCPRPWTALQRLPREWPLAAHCALPRTRTASLNMTNTP